MKTIAVKVTPKARVEKIEKLADGSYRVWTFAAPDRGAANDATTRMLARELGVAPSTITLKRGAASRNKVFEVPD